MLLSDTQMLAPMNVSVQCCQFPPADGCPGLIFLSWIVGTQGPFLDADIADEIQGSNCRDQMGFCFQPGLTWALGGARILCLSQVTVTGILKTQVSPIHPETAPFATSTESSFQKAMILCHPSLCPFPSQGPEGTKCKRPNGTGKLIAPFSTSCLSIRSSATPFLLHLEFAGKMC